MTKYLCKGALVKAIAGREANEIFIITNVENGYADLVNGKSRPIENPKKKNIKHIKSVKQAVLVDLALQINSGCCVGNKKIYSMLKSAIKNKQED